MSLRTLRFILEELRRFDSFDHFLEQERTHGNWLPGFVAAGDGRSLYLSAKSEKLISQLAQELKQQKPTLSKSHTDEEWKNVVRTALGRSITQQEEIADLAAASTAAYDSLKRELSTLHSHASSISFGVSLFSSPIAPAFEMGPVRIEPRLQWLEAGTKTKSVSVTAARRIKRHWEGLSLRKRRPSSDSLREQDVIDAVGPRDYVCTVMTNGMAWDFARIKATVAAHLCLAVLSLAWEHPSKALQGFWLNNDAGPYRQWYLKTTHDGQLLASRHKVGLPYALNVRREDWQKYANLHCNVRLAAGAVLSQYLSLTSDPAKPDVSIALFHAMLWFYEGCREPLDHSAIVKFGASLDALAAGEDVHGILTFIEARAGLTRDRLIYGGETTVKALVESIYRQRSQSIHGNSTKARNDAANLRAKSEKLARLCLLEALEWANENGLSTSPKAMQSLG